MFRGVCHWPYVGLDYGLGSDEGMKTDWKLFKWTDFKQRWWQGWDGIFTIKNYSQDQYRDIKVWLFDNMKENRYNLDINLERMYPVAIIHFRDRNDAMLFRMWLSD